MLVGEPGQRNEGDEALRVLVLFANQRTLPANKLVQEGLWSSLSAAVNSNRIELFEEYLEVYRLSVGDPDEEPAMVSFLRERYENMEPDIVVSLSFPASAFSERWIDRIFPDAIRVFGVVREDELAALPGSESMVGVLNTVAVKPLLDAILDLMPETREVIVVGGATSFDRILVDKVRRTIEAEFSLKVTEVVGGTPESVATRLSQESPGAVVLFTTYFKDETGVTYIPMKVVKKLSAASSVPVFAFFDTMFGSGVLGVAASPFYEQGRLVGEVVERIAVGESPSEIGIVSDRVSKLLFDDRAMKRFRLDPRKLPPDAELLFRKPGLIESHPIAFAVGTGTIAIQTFLIVALLVTRQRKQRAERLALEMQHYFSTVFYKSPNPMAVLELTSGSFRDINPEWENLFGFSRENSLGRSPVEMGLLPRDNDSVLYEDFLRAKPNFAGYERKMRTAAGDVHTMALFSSPVEVGGEELCIVTAMDTSDREEAERLRSSLARDNRAAQLGHISAWIAHEINQPLGSILSNAEAGLLELDREGDHTAELREILADIRADNRRATRVVEQIRKMLGKSASDMRPIGVSEILDEVQRMATPQASRQSVDFRINTNELNDVTVHGDRVLLVQVLLNLIFNAMDAVAVQPLSSRHVSVTGQILEGGNEFEILVSDGGEGVPVEKMDSIFEFFYSTKDDGMGLGLAISRFIIEDHKGALAVENQEKGGACFRVRLPCLRAV